MSVSVQCPCGCKVMTDQAAGHVVRCPDCGEILVSRGDRPLDPLPVDANVVVDSRADVPVEDECRGFYGSGPIPPSSSPSASSPPDEPTSRPRLPWYRRNLLASLGMEKLSWLALSIIIAVLLAIAVGLLARYEFGIRSWYRVATVTGYGLLAGFVLGVWTSCLIDTKNDPDWVPPPDWLRVPVVLVTFLGAAILFFNK